jgi:hypothetical protein
MKLIAIFALVFAANAAHAWDCNDPKNWSLNVPGNECYHKGPNPNAPQGTTVNGTQSQSSTNRNTATGGNSTATVGNVSASGGSANATGGKSNQTQTATGGNAQGGNATGGSATGGNGTGGQGGSSDQSQHQSQGNGNSQSSSTYVASNVPSLMLPTQIITGCQVAGAAGGANTRAAGMLGIEFTPEECYSFIDAQANLAVGDYQTACEILHSNKSTERAKKRGAKIADCALLVQKVVTVEVVHDTCGPDCEAGIQLRIQHAIADYIESHPAQPCPKPHKGVHHYAPCKMTVTVSPTQGLGDAGSARPPQ